MRSHSIAAAVIAALCATPRSTPIVIVDEGYGDDVLSPPKPRALFKAAKPVSNDYLARIEAAQRRRAAKVARQAKGFRT